MRRLFFGCCAAAVFFVLMVASASAAPDIIEPQGDEGPDAGFQAGVCTADSIGEGENQQFCSSETPQLFFTQAAGHPPDAFTQILVKKKFENAEGEIEQPELPKASAKTFLVDLPAGLSINPQATPQCELEVNEKGEEEIPNEGVCPEDTRVGYSIVSAAAFGTFPITFDPFPVYNLKPRPGEPARFGFSIGNLADVFLNAGVSYQSDYHEYFTIHVPNPLESNLISDRLYFDGTTGQSGPGGAFISNPSTCYEAAIEPFRRGYATTLHADSREEEAPEDEYDVAAPAFPPIGFVTGSQERISYLPKGAKPENCSAVPFTPTAQTAPGTNSTDTPAPATVEVKVPFSPQAPVYESNVKTAKVSLPQGLGLNPAAAAGLQTCTESQFGIGTRGPDVCPAGSRLGSVEIETPVLPAGTLKGSAFLAPQASNDPESGSLYRVWLEASSVERGIAVRLAAKVSANKTTGRLTATIENAPQLPFTAVKVNLNGTGTPVLTSPSTCGPNVTDHAFEAYSGTPDGGVTEPGFSLASAPGGGNCAKYGVDRPFAPGFAAGPASTDAKAETSYTLKLERKDGEQELKGIDVTLPPGQTARLEGVDYCSEASISSAASSTGHEQIAKPSCPDSSFIGTVKVAAGSGNSPLQLAGNAYLSGPYRGAPLSMAIVTPVVVGPFDLGTVVVRAALFVEPESGQVHVVSDPIPDVVGGAKVDLRSLTVDLSRQHFITNGTGCQATSVGGSVAGGGNDPNGATGFTYAKVSAGAQTTGCERLGFSPRLKLSLTGKTKRAAHPSLHAILKARSVKDSDIAKLSVALPKTLFLDQASLGTVCTNPQFAAGQCPEKSIYGYATAYTPLLAQPLSGPVYLRSSTNNLPDLVAHLQGQVTIDLDGRIDSFKGGIRTSFESVPDLPVSKFELNLPGGKHGLLISSRNLCEAPVKAQVKAQSWSGKTANLSNVVATKCGKAKKGAKGKKGGGGKKG